MVIVSQLEFSRLAYYGKLTLDDTTFRRKIPGASDVELVYLRSFFSRFQLVYRYIRMLLFSLFVFLFLTINRLLEQILRFEIVKKGLNSQLQPLNQNFLLYTQCFRVEVGFFLVGVFACLSRSQIYGQKFPTSPIQRSSIKAKSFSTNPHIFILYLS